MEDNIKETTFFKVCAATSAHFNLKLSERVLPLAQ
jgi:hypothetical protein